MNEKAREGFNINLDPYPGNFLRWTVYPKAFLTSLLLSLGYVGKAETSAYFFRKGMKVGEISEIQGRLAKGDGGNPKRRD